MAQNEHDVRSTPVGDVFRTPDDRFAGLPGYDFVPHYTEVEGLRLHYVDEGVGRPIVCFHGEPTWAYVYRKMIEPLVEAGHRVVVPDYPGFGRSDKPFDRDWYTYDRVCEHVDGVLGGLNLEHVTVVVHDWGGAIGLRWAMENSERVDNLVLLNTGLFTGRQPASNAFIVWLNFVRNHHDLPIGLTIQAATVEKVPDDNLAGYEAPFPTPQSKAGATQFPLLVPLNVSDVGAREQGSVEDELAKWDKPALVCFSDADPVFPPDAGQRLVDLIPGAEPLVLVEGASHFLQEDRGEHVAKQIKEFLLRAGTSGSDGFST